MNCQSVLKIEWKQTDGQTDGPTDYGWVAFLNSHLFVILVDMYAKIPVSYTHLTLPTNREV